MGKRIGRVGVIDVIYLKGKKRGFVLDPEWNHKVYDAKFASFSISLIFCMKPKPLFGMTIRSAMLVRQCNRFNPHAVRSDIVALSSSDLRNNISSSTSPTK